MHQSPKEVLPPAFLLHVDENLRHPSRLAVLEEVTDGNSKINNVVTVCFKARDADLQPSILISWYTLSMSINFEVGGTRACELRRGKRAKGLE